MSLKNMFEYLTSGQIFKETRFTMGKNHISGRCSCRLQFKGQVKGVSGVQIPLNAERTESCKASKITQLLDLIERVRETQGIIIKVI